jgi:hypothetical protein
MPWKNIIPMDEIIRFVSLAQTDRFTITELCLQFNISRKTAYQHLERYFLRTRVQLDADGDIISANYAKIYDEIRFDARGLVSFWYYYNPTPNDRNLEFDPARNLFPQSMKGANVANP